MTRAPIATTLIALALSVAVSTFASARAADLDAFYPGDVAAPRPAVINPPLFVEQRVVVTSPLSVGGPYVPIPGLNGPTGPSAYPLLPFAFGYGY